MKGMYVGGRYAVYINGVVNTNRTFQAPVEAHNDYFDITIPWYSAMNQENTAPKFSQFEDVIEVYPVGTNLQHDAKYQNFLYTVGLPIDYQLDQFYVSEWGVKGYEPADEDYPHWIQFINSTAIGEDGVQFKITPGIDQMN